MDEQAVATIATVLTAVLLVPQIVRLVRLRERAGVAVTWAALGFVTNAAWVVYLGLTDLKIAMIAPTFAVIAYAMVVSLVAPVRRRLWLVGSAAYGVSLAGIGFVGGIGHLGLALAIVPALQMAPQIVVIYRESCPTGVSPATWIMSVVEAGLWLVYGLMIGDAPLIGYGLVTGTGSVIVLSCWWTSMNVLTQQRRAYRPSFEPRDEYEPSRESIVLPCAQAPARASSTL